MRHKLMSVMFEREGSRKLDGRVEMDDVVLGGEKSEADAANAVGEDPTRPLSLWPSKPAMTGGRCVCCCTW